MWAHDQTISNMIKWPWQENRCNEDSKSWQNVYLIGDGHKKTKTDTRVCLAEKSDDLAFLEQ